MAQLRNKNAVTAEVPQGMLKTKFYTSLRLSYVNNAFRHRYDGGESYSDL